MDNTTTLLSSTNLSIINVCPWICPLNWWWFLWFPHSCTYSRASVLIWCWRARERSLSEFYSYHGSREANYPDLSFSKELELLPLYLLYGHIILFSAIEHND